MSNISKLAELIKSKDKDNVRTAYVANNSQVSCDGRLYRFESTISNYMYKDKRVYVIICNDKAIIVGD